MGPDIPRQLQNVAVPTSVTFSIPAECHAASENWAAEKDRKAVLELVVNVTGQDELQVIGSIDEGQKEAIHSTCTVGIQTGR